MAAITPAIAHTLKERFGLDARLQDPHLAVAKGAALFALIAIVLLGSAQLAHIVGRRMPAT